MDGLPKSEATREIFWNVYSPANRVAMYAFLALSLVVFGWGIWRRVQLWVKGQPAAAGRLGNWGARFELLWDGVLKQKGTNRLPKPRIFHTLIFWGFFVLFFATLMVFIDYDLGLDIYHGRYYLAVTFLADIFGLLLLVGLALAYYRRYFERPDKLHNTRADALMFFLLALMCVQGFVLEGLRIQATNDPWAWYSPVGAAFGGLFWGVSVSGLETLHYGVWWFHTLTVFGFIAILPYSKFFHILASSANLFFKDLDRPTGAMKFEGDLEEIMEEALSSDDGEFKFGVTTLGDLSWKQRLDLDACTSCGRCQEVCPAYNSGKALSPKWLILDSRNHMLGLRADALLEEDESRAPALDSLDRVLLKNLLVEDVRPETHSYRRAANERTENAAREVGLDPAAALSGDVMDEEVFWACTSCRACVEVCPVGIEHLDHIMDVRRSMALMDGNIPSEAQPTLRAIETRGNPFGSAEQRADWTEGLDVPILAEGDEVDVLYWVGCVSAYDKRKQNIARSMAKILNQSGIRWGILGTREHCTGDPARRLGEENLFQSSAKKNIDVLRTIRFHTMVANCPHCFNTLKNEYPDLGRLSEGEVRVVHHTELLQELIHDGVLKLRPGVEKNLTYHDPCYLGRYNGHYDEPRNVLVQLGAKNHEMRDNRERGMCCGAGGGHYWFDMKVGERINSMRVEQAAETGVSMIATGCPFCMQMLEDGVKITGREENMEVRDLAELIADSLLDSSPETSLHPRVEQELKVET